MGDGTGQHQPWPTLSSHPVCRPEVDVICPLHCLVGPFALDCVCVCVCVLQDTPRREWMAFSPLLPTLCYHEKRAGTGTTTRTQLQCFQPLHPHRSQTACRYTTDPGYTPFCLMHLVTPPFFQIIQKRGGFSCPLVVSASVRVE